VVGCLCAAAALLVGPRLGGTITVRNPPPPSAGAPYTRWPTPPIARTFDYPLQPPEAYSPYVQGITGWRAIDTRFGAQNPALGNRSNCFRDRSSNAVPFRQLYHAGVDLFSRDRAGQFMWGGAGDDPVHAIADGVVVSALDAGAEGQILITHHLLPDESAVYAVYWHVDRLRVGPGQPVAHGQVIALVHDQGLNSHLHWEMRTFLDGSHLFPPGSAGARGTCNGHFAGVGYTWDDAPERARPEVYGYLDPLVFVAEHQ
jgi:murein DD-endopeptidase MepM/ murein hydrolase activator NlpD